MSDELTVEHLVAEVNMDLERLRGIVEEVSKGVADGNLDGAALVLGTQAGKIGRFNASYHALYERVGGQEAGERALKNGSD